MHNVKTFFIHSLFESDMISKALIFICFVSTSYVFLVTERGGYGISHILLGICIGGSSIFDLWKRKIPNRWLAIWIFAGGLWAAENGFRFLLSMVSLVIIFSPLYLFRMIGAGDIKLMAVICGYLGLSDGFLLITYSFFLGAVFSTLKMIQKGIFLERIFYFIAYFRRFFHTGERIEYYRADRDGYGAAIHFGVCLWLGFVIYLFFH